MASEYVKLYRVGTLWCVSVNGQRLMEFHPTGDKAQAPKWAFKEARKLARLYGVQLYISR